MATYDAGVMRSEYVLDLTNLERNARRAKQILDDLAKAEVSATAPKPVAPRATTARGQDPAAQAAKAEAALSAVRRDADGPPQAKETVTTRARVGASGLHQGADRAPIRRPLAFGIALIGSALFWGAVFAGLLIAASKPAKAAGMCAETLAVPGVVSTRAGGDVLALASVAPAVLHLCYANNAAVNSRAGEYVLTLEGATVRATIHVRRDAERIEVQAPPGWHVWPADDAAQGVDDGAETVVVIVGGMS